MTATQTKVIDPSIKAKKNDVSKLTRVDLTPQQAKQWEMTRSALLWGAPAFTHILYSMMTVKDTRSDKDDNIAIFTKDIPVAATDGSHLLLNPDTFFKFALGERVFVVAHEIMHCVMDHCGQMHAFERRGKISYPSGKSLKYVDQYMNVAADLVINDLLVESKVGSFNKEWLHDTNVARGTDSVIDAYAKVYKEQQKQGGGGGGGGGQGKGKDDGPNEGQNPGQNPRQGFDQHLKPGTADGKDAEQKQQERNPQEWKTAVAAARDAAKAQGKLPAALERFFGDMLDPQVSWSEKIQAFFARKVGSGSYDWRRADRRLIVRDIYAPGRSGFGAGTVVVGFDTSGSIYADATLIDRFMAEIGGILSDVRPKRLVILWCDAKVHRHDEVDELTDLKGLKPVGGGGTAFEPVFDWITQQGIEPDALVYLTDGLGSFPTTAPNYPVLWGNIYEGSKYPFGEVVDVPNQK